jgi:hypothetical protein
MAQSCFVQPCRETRLFTYTRSWGNVSISVNHCERKDHTRIARAEADASFKKHIAREKAQRRRP